MNTTKYTINCTGDVVAGDTILFTEAVFGGSHRKPKYLGERTIAAMVLRESYGAVFQQHTFTIEVIGSTGVEPLREGLRTTRKGRNIYRNGTRRLPWADENARAAAAAEKHERGDEARAARQERKGF